MDSKCRVSVPSAFRNSLKNQSFKGVVAFPSYNDNSIDACGIERMEKISENLDSENNYSRDEFDPDTEFIPVSAGNNPELYRVLVHEQPVIHDIGE